MATEDLKKSDQSQSVPEPQVPVLQVRAYWFITGVLLPLVLMALLPMNRGSLGSTLGASLWQSGSIQVFADLLLDRSVVPYFYPFVFLASLGLAIYCKSPLPASRWVRLALLSGLLLYLQFSALLVLAIDNYVVYGPLTAIIVAMFLGQLIRSIASLKRFSIARVLLFTTFVAFPIALLADFVGQGLNENNFYVVIVPLSLLEGALTSVPLLGLSTYAWAVMCAMESRLVASRLRQLNRWNWLAIFTWLIGYCAAWKFAIEAVIQLYSQLPKTKPNCYVSTAAARGHRWLVGSEPNADGHLVNWQMRYAKVLEFMLASASPGVHRQIRRLYNRLGPIAASRIESRPWLADVAYLLLFPAELIARVLVWLLRVDRRLVAKLYE